MQKLLTEDPKGKFHPSNNGAGGCSLDVYLLDKFGDGWNGAAFIIQNKDFVEYRSPLPGTAGSVIRVILPVNQVSSLSVRGQNGPKVPKEYWDIIWSFHLHDNIYTGRYGTQINLKCINSPIDGFLTELLDASGLVETSCTRCPHPSSSYFFLEKYLNHHSLSKNLMKTSSQSNTTAVPLEDAFSVHVTLHSQSGLGWYHFSAPFTKFTISNSNRTILFAEGTICGSLSTEVCEYQLSDGAYVFRVGGNGDSRAKTDVSWNFCGVRGGPREEFSFVISDGHCLAGPLVKSAQNSLYANYSTSDFDPYISNENARTIEGYVDYRKFEDLNGRGAKFASKQFTLSSWGLLIGVGLFFVAVITLGLTTYCMSAQDDTKRQRKGDGSTQRILKSLRRQSSCYPMKLNKLPDLPTYYNKGGNGPVEVGVKAGMVANKHSNTIVTNA